MLVPRGKVVGGSIAINAQIFLRGVPEDYDTWAAWGNDQWGFQELLPYFRKTETDTDFQGDRHGAAGPIIVRRFQWLSCFLTRRHFMPRALPPVTRTAWTIMTLTQQGSAPFLVAQ
jgi:choline dehydrogenase-like flavoprotein